MSLHFLPDVYTRATSTTVAVPVSGHADLMDPMLGWSVIPARIETTLTLFEGTPDGTRTYGLVAVIGPRRLKSQAAGREVTSLGWEAACNVGARGRVQRPDWLTEVLADNLPAGWERSLLELPGTAGPAASTPVLVDEAVAFRKAAALVGELIEEGEHDPGELVQRLLYRASELEAGRRAAD